MIQIIISTILLSAIHATIPNHWIPIIAVSKAEQWSQKQTLFAVLFTGFAHTISTILIGIMVGLAGYRLAAKYEFISQILSPIILVGLGITYILIDRYKDHFHSYTHSHEPNIIRTKSKTSGGVLFSLSLSMFLMPCVEIEAYYFQAGMIGWKGIFAVSATYTLTTVLLMLLLVYAGFKGIQRLRLHTLEHHEKLITGIVLVFLGILTFFMKL